MAVVQTPVDDLFFDEHVREVAGVPVYGQKGMFVTVDKDADPMSSASLPLPGTVFSPNHTELRLEERSATPVNADGTDVRYKIDLIYRHWQTANRSSVSATGDRGMVPRRGDGTLDVRELVFEPWQVGSRIRVQVQQSSETGGGIKVREAAPVQLPAPSLITTREIELRTQTPEWFSHCWTGTLNLYDWLWEGDALQWKCMNVDYELTLDGFNFTDAQIPPPIGRFSYIFRFTFQKAPWGFGWDVPVRKAQTAGGTTHKTDINDGFELRQFSPVRNYNDLFPALGGVRTLASIAIENDMDEFQVPAPPGHGPIDVED